MVVPFYPQLHVPQEQAPQAHAAAYTVVALAAARVIPSVILVIKFFIVYLL